MERESSRNTVEVKKKTDRDIFGVGNVKIKGWL